MSFWGAYVPYLENTALFISQPFERNIPTDTLGLTYTWIYQQDTACNEVCQFLYNYFGNPPQKPRFSIPIQHLLSKTDLLLLARDNSTRIVGCIRYHDIGVLYHNKCFLEYLIGGLFQFATIHLHSFLLLHCSQFSITEIELSLLKSSIMIS